MAKCQQCGAVLTTDKRHQAVKKYCDKLCRTAASNERIRGHGPRKRWNFDLLERALKGWMCRA